MPPSPEPIKRTLTDPTPNLHLKADQCVKCGLCLPHCPTYRLFQDENESPRGRLSLFQALANGQIQATAKVRQHIQHCLGCRACERACPSGVEYAYLLDHTRQRLEEQESSPPLPRRLAHWGLGLFNKPRLLHHVQTALYLYQRFGLRRLIRLSGLLRLLRLQRLDQLLPDIARYRPFQPRYAADTPQTKARVGLFIGCTGHLFDQVTAQDTLRLLQSLGYEVVIPPQQGCCGALHQHQGQLDAALDMARRNLQAFAGLDRVIYIASGCGSQLHDYPRLAWANSQELAEAKSLASNLYEVTAFLAKEDLSRFKFSPLHKHIAIHTPCSLRNGLRQADASQDLLRHIPGLQIHAIPSETGCCGAAGSFMLTEGTLATRIRQNTLNAVHGLGAEIVSTTNIGCSMHIHAGLGDSIPCTHPVSLLARQIDP